MRTKTMRRAAFASFVAALTAVAVAAPSVWAGKPIVTRINIDETTPDTFLSEACGVDVMTQARGHVITREFDRAKGTVELTTFAVRLTAMAGDNSYRFHDVGNDHIKITKDGPILQIVGQVPFEHTGALKINLDTGEVIHEPSHDISGRLEDACAALTA